MGLLTVAVAGPVLVMARSVEAMTEVVADAVLLAAFGSASLPLTVAVFVMLPPFAGAVALIVIEALAPEASEPTLQVTVPEALVQVPGVELADTKVTPVGRLSVTTTPVAGLGPLLVAISE